MSRLWRTCRQRRTQRRARWRRGALPPPQRRTRAAARSSTPSPSQATEMLRGGEARAGGRAGEERDDAGARTTKLGHSSNRIATTSTHDAHLPSTASWQQAPQTLRHRKSARPKRSQQTAPRTQQRAVACPELPSSTGPTATETGHHRGRGTTRACGGRWPSFACCFAKPRETERKSRIVTQSKHHLQMYSYHYCR